jgi:hypothetical protein
MREEPTFMEMFDDLLGLAGGAAAGLLPLIILAVPCLVLLIPLLIPLVVLGVVGAALAAPLLAVRALRRRR